MCCISSLNSSSVYVVLLNWNGYEDTCRCITSLLESDCYVNIVVVDNKSTERDIDQVLDVFPGVYYIKNDFNAGFSAGNNIGIKFALAKNADYIFILNNDTTVNNDCISKLVEFMETNEKAIAASPLVLNGNESDLIWYGGGDFKWTRGGAISYRLNVDVNNASLPIYEKVGFISGCAMFIRAKAIRNAEWFDENFFMYVEDVDFSIRLNKIGEIYFVSKAIILHYAHSTLRKKANTEFGGAPLECCQDKNNVIVRSCPAEDISHFRELLAFLDFNNTQQGDHREFRNPASHLNRNLNFFIENVLRGYFYLLAKHKPSLKDKVGFYIYFYLRWIKRSILFLLKGKFYSSFIILKIITNSFRK